MLLEPLADWLAELRGPQRTAADWDQGSMLVMAGPGSGKTRVLTSRIARIISEFPDASFRILALTFTNKAADEMIDRVEQLVPANKKRTFIGTFHGFCTDVLRQHGVHIGIQPNFRIYSTDADRLELLSDALRQSDLVANAKLLNTFDRLQSALITPQEASSNDSLDRRVIDAYNSYYTELFAHNALDYCALILQCCELFRAFPAIAKRYRTLYRYWCIDEFQDTNRSQYALVRLMAGNQFRNIFAVADDDQIIYQWNGASHKRIDEFIREFDPTIIQLPTNYRCPAPIVELANNLIRNNEQRMKGKLPLESAKRADNTCVEVRRYSSHEKEFEAIALAIKELNEISNVAVLARTRKLLLAAQGALTKHGIKSDIHQRRDDFGSSAFAWLHACLRQGANRSDRRNVEVLSGAFESLTGISVSLTDVHAETADLLVTGDYLLIWLQKARTCGCDEQVEKVLDLVEQYLVKTVDFRTFITKALDWFQGFYAPNSPGYTPQVVEEYQEDRKLWIALQRDIFSNTSDAVTLDIFLQELQLKSKEPAASADTVRLMTIHAAKGTGFAHIFLIGLAEGELPSFGATRYGADPAEMEEERRNCFVAITRAEQTLQLSFANQYFGWSRVPSRFLYEMGFEPDQLPELS